MNSQAHESLLVHYANVLSCLTLDWLIIFFLKQEWGRRSFADYCFYSVAEESLAAQGTFKKHLVCGFHSDRPPVIYCGPLQCDWPPLLWSISKRRSMCIHFILLWRLPGDLYRLLSVTCIYCCWWCIDLFSRRGRGAGGVRGERGRSHPLLHRAFPRRRRAAGGQPSGAQQQRRPLLVPLATGTSIHLRLTGRSNVSSLSLNLYNPTLYQPECT